jgi:hypothetical protein
MSDGLKNAEKIRVLVLGDSGVFLVRMHIFPGLKRVKERI